MNLLAGFWFLCHSVKSKTGVKLIGCPSCVSLHTFQAENFCRRENSSSPNLGPLVSRTLAQCIFCAVSRILGPVDKFFFLLTSQSRIAFLSLMLLTAKNQIRNCFGFVSPGPGQQVDIFNAKQQNLFFKTVWPSGLRRWLKAPVRKGVSSNPTAVICYPSLIYDTHTHTLLWSAVTHRTWSHRTDHFELKTAQ